MALKGVKDVRGKKSQFVSHGQFIDSTFFVTACEREARSLQPKRLSFTPFTKTLCSLSLFLLSDALTMERLSLFIVLK